MSNLEPEEENRAFSPPFLAALTSDEEWEEILQEVEGSSEEHLSPALAEARVAVARLAQEKPQHGRGLLTTLWLFASPVFAAMTLANLYGGQWDWLALNAFCLLTSRHLYNVTDQNEQMRTALNVHEATPKWVGSLAEVLDWPAPRAQKLPLTCLRCYFLMSLKATGSYLLPLNGTLCTNASIPDISNQSLI